MRYRHNDQEQKDSSNTETIPQNVQKQEVSPEKEEKLVEEKNISESKTLQYNMLGRWHF